MWIHEPNNQDTERCHPSNNNRSVEVGVVLTAANGQHLERQENQDDQPPFIAGLTELKMKSM
jgi:hypothetical protein